MTFTCNTSNHVHVHVLYFLPGGMACINIFGNDGQKICDDPYSQRKYIQQLDPHLYKILNYVYNNDRAYVESETSTCIW